MITYIDVEKDTWNDDGLLFEHFLKERLRYG
jgi:hypothetical protein